MAIYTGGMRMQQEARNAASRIAKQQAKAQAGEAKRKGRAGLFGKIGGMAMGTLAVGAMGLTGGLAAPLIMGAASSLGKKWADEASKKGVFKTPGQVDKIEAGGKYGYGREEAASLTQGLEESRKTEFGAETMLGDIGSSYLSAGMAGGLSGGAKTLASGEKGSLLKSLGGAEGTKGGWEGIKQAAGYEIGGLGEGGKGDFASFLEQGKDVAKDVGSDIISSNIVEDDMYDPFAQETTVDEWGNPISMAQGGQIPQMDQNTMIGLALLSQMQQQQETAYSGTPLDNLSTGSTKKEKESSTIAEMFASQGKTLGGNNTQSLSQMLGR